MLFNPEDRLDENKIAYLIREMFSNRKVSNKKFVGLLLLSAYSRYA